MKSSAIIFLLALSIIPVLAIPINTSIDPNRLILEVKSNNTTFLSSVLTKSNINDCHFIEGSSHSILTMSIATNAMESFNLILESADPNYTCNSKTPLMLAAEYGRLDMLKILLKNNADINQENCGKTALDYALESNQIEIIEYLSRP